MRCLALAEEVRRRDVEIVFVCDAHTVPWAAEQIAARGIGVERAVALDIAVSPKTRTALFGPMAAAA